MAAMEIFYKRNQSRCPSCVNLIYPSDCDIVATVDAVVPLEMVPHGVPTVAPSSGDPKNAALIQEHTILKKAPPRGSLKQTRARMDIDPLVGDLYTRTLACRVCPICGYRLPPNFGNARGLTVAIVGDTTSGKSLYLAALIKQLQSGKLVRIDQQLTFTSLTADIENHYIQNYFKPVFDQKHVLPPSQLFTETTHTPLIYELTIRTSKDRPAKVLNLIIYDTAGEDYVVQKRMVHFAPYVLKADALIFLADPITMPEIANRLPPGINYTQAPGRPATDGFNKMIALIKQGRDQERLRSLPVAIALSKSDLLKYLVPISGQYNFMLPHEYRSGLDLSDLEKINREVRDFIERFGDPTLLQAAEALKNVHFFATSATGYPPDQSGALPAVEPRRCLDPLLWILYKLKIMFSDSLF